MLIVTLECCAELEKVLSRMLLSSHIFDHSSYVEIAETFLGCRHPSSSAPCKRSLDYPLTRNISKKLLSVDKSIITVE